MSFNVELPRGASERLGRVHPSTAQTLLYETKNTHTIRTSDLSLQVNVTFGGGVTLNSKAVILM